MKSYTDLEQSKKLAEILQIESADNVIVSFGSREGTTTLVMPKETLDVIRTPFSDIRKVIPCWSLTALLNVFPNSEQTSVDICHGGWKVEEYISDWFCSYDDYEKNYFETTNSDNPIDACYEMIIKLKSEQGL